MLCINTPVTWKVCLTGKPDAIKRALDTFMDNLYGDGRADFLRVKKTLDDLLALNIRTTTDVSFAANGDKDHLAVLLMSSTATHVD